MDALLVKDNLREQEKWIKINDGHRVMTSKPSYKNILFSDGKTKLFDCVSSLGKTTTLKKFLQNTDDINTALPSNSPLWPGSTPLHLVVMYCESLKNEDKISHLINQFLDQGASVQVQNLCGATPLHLAFRFEQQQIISLLLRNLETKAIQVSNLLDKENLSILHIACTANDHRYSLTRKLLSNDKSIGSTVNAVYKGEDFVNVKNGWTPLHVAVHQCQPSLVELLLQRGASMVCKDARGYTPIHWLFNKTTMKSLADVLLASEQLRESAVDATGLTHLHVAISFDNIKAVERLLDLDSNIEASITSVQTFEREDKKKFVGCTPLRMAMIMDRNTIIEILVQRGANLLAKIPDGTSILSKALTGSYDHITARAVVRGIWSNENLQKRLEDELGLTMLHIACFSRNVVRVQAMLDEGKDVNARTRENCDFWMGYTPLHVLVDSCNWINNEMRATFMMLVQSGCNVNQQNSRGQTAFHLAFRAHLCTITKFTSELLSVGTDINIVDKSGKSVLSYALELYSRCKYPWEINNFQTVMSNLILHLRKMKLVALDVSALNETLLATALRNHNALARALDRVLALGSWDKSAFYYQVQATETIKIGKCNMSLRSLLCETGMVTRYPSLTPNDRNELSAFIQSIDHLSFLDVLPLIKLQYRKAVARLSLIDPARDALKTFICTNFPDLCVDVILKYLSNSQLNQLITAASIIEMAA